MTHDITGKHLVAGEWTEGGRTFENRPVTGDPRSFAAGTPELVDAAAKAAEEAFWSYASSSRDARASFLESIADEIEARGDAITAIGTAETGLPAARLEGERGRTTGQLRLFASHIRGGGYLDRRHDEALADGSRPDLRMIQLPIGPVGVFGASNFPLAFSTAGGDTASALAAGCPVVCKGHDAHPGTAELVAQAIDAAIRKHDLHPGVFSLVQGGDRSVGQALVQHPLIKAIGFTGSLAGGRALYDLAARRDEPIPFFGELGSVNPMFVLPAALAARGKEIAEGWAGSLTMGVGQFCTNPGIAVLPEGEETRRFVAAAKEALGKTAAQTMLTEGIADAYRTGADHMKTADGVTEVLEGTAEGRNAGPWLFETDADHFTRDRELAHEVFGPLGLVVTVSSPEAMVDLAKGFEGQLTMTLQMDEADTDAAKALMPVLQRKAGRILANGFPTGVAVSDAMVHGGPYPASTNFGATSVGTLAIRRFLRPVCLQNLPEALLPTDLR